MRIRPAAIIFDYGNVLSEPQPWSDVQAMASILDLPAETFRRVYWQFRLAYDEAALDPEAYWTTVAQAVSRRLTDSQILVLIEIDCRGWAHPAAVIPEWARQLHRAGLRTALLSNMPVPVRDYVSRCTWLPPFHHRTFSCDVRAAKPSVKIYRHCLNGLGVAPSDVLFLDDRPENVQAAQALGMHGVVFTTLGQAAAELDRRFDIPVPLAATVVETQSPARHSNR
ncbi:MAG TPA: HAD family phosphatase [Bryobacteraceae bacterium]|nr:HAD family phosphatase [Bryobacteraceae bacterium]